MSQHLNSHVEFQLLIPQNVTVFGDRTFKDVIELMEGHQDGGPHPTGLVSLSEEETGHWHPQREDRARTPREVSHLHAEGTGLRETTTTTTTSLPTPRPQPSSSRTVRKETSIV